MPPLLLTVPIPTLVRQGSIKKSACSFNTELCRQQLELHEIREPTKGTKGRDKCKALVDVPWYDKPFLRDGLADLVEKHVNSNRDFTQAIGLPSRFKTRTGYTKRLASLVSLVLVGGRSGVRTQNGGLSEKTCAHWRNRRP